MENFYTLGNPDYAKDVERALNVVWKGKKGGGVAVFTSAGTLYLTRFIDYISSSSKFVNQFSD